MIGAGKIDLEGLIECHLEKLVLFIRLGDMDKVIKLLVCVLPDKIERYNIF